MEDTWRIDVSFMDVSDLEIIRQTGRQTDRQMDRQIDRQKEQKKERNKESKRKKYRQIDGQMNIDDTR